MPDTPIWTHLVRFLHHGVPTFAQLVNPKENGDLEEQFQAEIATGDPVFNTIKLTGEKVTVSKGSLLAPFATVPIVINTGLNYKDHVTESLFYSAPVWLATAEISKALADLFARISCPIYPISFSGQEVLLLHPIQPFSEPIRCSKSVSITKVS